MHEQIWKLHENIFVQNKTVASYKIAPTKNINLSKAYRTNKSDMRGKTYVVVQGQTNIGGNI